MDPSQFTPAELATIRTILAALPPVPALAELMIGDAVVPAIGGLQLAPLALHSIDFGVAQAAAVTNDHINQPIAQFSPAREHVLRSAPSLKYIATLIDYMRSLPNTPVTITQLEQIQIDVLCRLDALLGEIPRNTTKCLTWIVEERADEFVIAPFITCIPEANFHVMYYTITRTNFTRKLKVVVGVFLCEIPFEITIPPGQDSMTVVIIAKPNIDTTQDPPERGVIVTLYHDPALDTGAPAPAGTDSANMDTSQ